MSTSPLNTSILRNGVGNESLRNETSPTPPASNSSNSSGAGGNNLILDDVSVSHSTTLSCYFCKSLLKDARVLPCLHSFCKICLKTHWKNNNNSNTKVCPICKVAVDLNGSIENLPMNTYYTNFTGLVDSADSATESDFERLSLRSGMTGKNENINPTPTSSAGGSRGTSPPNNESHRRNGNNGWTAAVTPPRSKTHHVTDSWPIKPKGTNGTTNNGTPSGSLENNTIWKSHFNFPQFVKMNGDAPSSSSIQPQTTSTTPAPGINDSQGWQPLANNGTNVSDSVWSPPRTTPSGKPLCSCADKHPVTSRCRDCAEDLCDSCVDAHQRVKLARDHVIVRYPSDSVPSSTVTGNDPTAINAPAVTPPVIPKADVMRVYVDAVGKAKADSEKYLTKAKQGMAQIEETKILVGNMITRVEARYQSVIHEVQSMTQRHIAALQEREKMLLLRLEKIRQVKLNALKSQKDELNMSTLYLGEVAKQLTCCSQSGREMDLIDTCNSAIETIRKVQTQCGTLSVQEDDVFEYTPPEPAIIQSIMNYGFIGSSGYAPACRAEGDGLKRAILGKEARFIVVVKDHLNEQRVAGGDPLKVTILAPDSRPVRQTIVDGKNGTYRVQWKPNVEGDHIVAITLKDKHIQDSPFTVHIRSGRNYNNIGQQLFEFGGEGEAPGELCRPWGITCTKDGNIMVANRSNNRIEVYNKDGKPLYNFGVPGKLRGQFDRPASVVCDRMNRAVIADKDNHRIQIFTIEGEFLMMFGEKGSKNGQFNYPWDVATNSKDQILVSDTRNHRIQLFSPNGDFLAKYGFEGAMWKHFDSPRGVAFTADDQAVVTDFNNHRLLVVEADFNIAQFLGKEGSEDGMFTRPNGVCVDEEGHIIVADSRNDRIQIFSSSGVFVKKFGCKGTGPGEFDRPSGICISPEGKLIVVDFGNNRVQVF